MVVLNLGTYNQTIITFKPLPNELGMWPGASLAQGDEWKSDIIGFSIRYWLQQLEVCCSLWLHKHVDSVCIITRWQMGETEVPPCSFKGPEAVILTVILTIYQ